MEEAVVHDFYDKLREGQEYETILDMHFSTWFKTQDYGMDMQRLGVDRIFTKSTGERYTVEYKADIKCGETGNFAIETVSVLTDEGELKKHGWAVTSTAQLLMLYIPSKKLIYIVDMVRLRDHLADWAKKFPTFTAQNKGYVGVGILVPEAEIAKMARGRTTHA